jgi:two-component system, OmpR family, KDP operon response regulator KdpE
MNTKRPIKLLIVDDEPQVRRLLRAGFELEHFSVTEADSGISGVKTAAMQPHDLIILDIGLPDMDGATVVERLRGWSNVPIIVLSARSNEHEKVRLLQAGADDYVVKPFGMAELIARAHSAVRRHVQVEIGDPVLKIGPMTIDFSQRMVLLSGTRIHFSQKEYKLIQILAKNEGRIVTHSQLLREIWGAGHEQSSHYLRVLVRKVRHLIEADPANPRLLQTESGIGYKLSAHSDAGDGRERS